MAYTHTFHHTSPILLLMYLEGSMYECPPHNAPSLSLVYYHLRMYTSTWYSSSPLCEHRIIHRYGTYGLVCLYTSHICRLMPTHTAIFIVHVCGNALHIGTQCLYVKTDYTASCIYFTGITYCIILTVTSNNIGLV